MGTRARREREKENMRTAILGAATKIIIEDGYDSLSMRKIADAIDYTPTTLYNYYKDKAQILDDISRQVYEKIVSDVKHAFEENSDKPLDDQLSIGLKTFLNCAANNAETGRALMRSGMKAIFGPGETSDHPEDNGILILQNLLARGQQESVFRKLDSNMPWMLVTALIGFVLYVVENQLYADPTWGEMVNTYIEMLVSGLLIRKGQ